jgi:hypothetical protein
MFNLWGCSKVYPGCKNCYAGQWDKRITRAVWGSDSPRPLFSTAGAALTRMRKKCQFPGARLALSALLFLMIQASSARAQNISFTLVATFTNPAPANSDYFGRSVAAVGSDKVVIGAPLDDLRATDAGTAYLFSTNGALLTVFMNPTPAPGDNFGLAVSGVGSDKVLIGAYQDSTGATAAGAAYLFGTNGTLITTFTNPTPSALDNFGISLAAVGSDQVLIAAYNDNTGAFHAGAVYLFSAGGALLTTFTNPTPANNDNFGYSVAAVGSGNVLIGAPNDDTGATDAGAAYLFSTNGTLLTTFTNPTPAGSEFFGSSVAAVGLDKVLIGAWGDDTYAFNAGVAYLFGTNGTLLTTFTNPSPAFSGQFGWAVAGVGSDKVLIGSPLDDTGATNTGVSYLFSTDGAPLITFTNPIPVANNWFGYSAAAVDSNKVLISAFRDDTGATDAGAAYLFSFEVPTVITPRLSLWRTATNTLAVSWPSSSAGFILQQNLDGLATPNWSNNSTVPVNDGTTKTVIIDDRPGECFYRLVKP